MNEGKTRNRQAVFLFGGLLLSLGASALFHFINEWLGNPAVTAGLFPVSESVWEHMKLPFYSLLLILWVPWCPFLRRTPLSARTGVFAFVSFQAMLFLWAGYYGLRNGLGVQGLAADLGLLAVSLLAALWHAVLLLGHYYQKEKNDFGETRRPPRWLASAGSFYTLLLILLFYVLSFYRPGLPLFTVGA